MYKKKKKTDVDLKFCSSAASTRASLSLEDTGDGGPRKVRLARKALRFFYLITRDPWGNGSDSLTQTLSLDSNLDYTLHEY